MKILKLAGQITISRISNSSGNDCIEIRLTDKNSSIEFVTASVAFSEFAKAITGLGYQGCKLKLVNLESVGMTREHKSEDVYFPMFYGRELTPEARAAMQKFEVDGWVGREDDMSNHHRWVKDSKGQHGAKVSFTRFV